MGAKNLVWAQDRLREESYISRCQETLKRVQGDNTVFPQQILIIVIMGTDMDIKIDFTNMMADAIGDEHGITDKEIKDVNDLASKSLRELQDERRGKRHPFMDLPYQDDLIDEIEKLREFYKTIEKMGWRLKLENRF